MVLDPETLLEYEEISHLASPLALGKRLDSSIRFRPQQKIISDAVVGAFAGTSPRFIAVSIPQQFGKSFVTSVLTPQWVLELHTYGALPGGLVALMSYEDSLAMSWSLKIRREIEANPDIFATRLRKDTRAASYWETEAGGGVLAIGTGGSIQGRPTTLLGIDDPTKNFDQAMSPKHQQKLWDNWTSVLIGRLQPWTVVLVTMVRWAPDDFIGRVTSTDFEGNPDDWNYIRIPYISEGEGDPLGRPLNEPMLRPQADQTVEMALEEAKFLKESVSTYSWATLYGQDPRDAEGTIFPENKFRYWTNDPHDEDLYQLPSPEEFDILLMSWDMAFKDERQHDWVVGQLWGAKAADRYLIDQVRGHWGFTETARNVVAFAARHRSTYLNAQAVLVEDKANGTAIIDHLRSVVGGFVPVTPEESKLARAWACQPTLIGGNFYIPSRDIAPWVKDYTKEMSDFRGEGSGHDDQVDASTQAIKYLFNYTPQSTTLVSPNDIKVDAPNASPFAQIRNMHPSIRR